MAATVENLQEVLRTNLIKTGERVTIPWTSDGSGNYTESMVLRGWLVEIQTDPGATAPTDNYDIKLKDSNSVDVLADLALNRDTATTEFIPTPGSGITILKYLNGTYTFDVSNAGAAKTGTAVLTIKNI